MSTAESISSITRNMYIYRLVWTETAKTYHGFIISRIKNIALRNYIQAFGVLQLVVLIHDLIRQADLGIILTFNPIYSPSSNEYFNLYCY